MTVIVLASTSPTRQAMLRSAGLDFTAHAPKVDERALVAAHPEWLPADIALRLAEAKAEDVSSRHRNAAVIGADQVLALGAATYSKPRDTADCRRQLKELRGKTHLLISAVVCARDGKAAWSHVAEARLTMRDFSDDFLEQYLAGIGSDCTSSVGGYKIEGAGLQLFEKVEGDHFTILGLPLLALMAHLRSTGDLLS
jgi:septum formation protein